MRTFSHITFLLLTIFLVGCSTAKKENINFNLSFPNFKYSKEPEK